MLRAMSTFQEGPRGTAGAAAWGAPHTLLPARLIPVSQPGSSRCPSLAEQPRGAPAAKTRTSPHPWALTARPCAHGSSWVFHLILKKKILNQFIKGMWFVLSERKMPPKQLTRGCCGCGTDVLSPHNLDCVWCCTSFISLF